MSEKVGEIYYDVTLDTGKMIDGQRQISREVDKTALTFNRIIKAVQLYAAAMAALKLVKMADDFRLLGSRVAIAAGSMELGAQAMSSLVAMSRRTSTSLEANAEVFSRLNQSILQMGGTQRDTLQLTELLGKAIRVSGASATEAKSAMLQFGQALGSGKLAGDELRSLMENAPYLMRQLADGLGVPLGALKKLGEDGKLTAEVVTQALSKAAAKIDEDFKKVPLTLEAAMTVARDQAALAVLSFDNLTGSSSILSGVFKGLGDAAEAMGQQFASATSEVTGLGKDKTVTTWADKTFTAMSYVADAVDMVWQTVSVLGRNVGFVFDTLGSQIGGIAAMAAAAAQGEFSRAKSIWDEMSRDDKRRREELDAADQKTLSGMLAGQKMRQQRSALASTPEADRLDRLAQGGGPAGTLRGTGGDDGKKPKKVKESRALEEDAAAWEERFSKLQDSQDAAMEKFISKGREFAQDLIFDTNPIAQLQIQLQEKSALLAEHFAADQENAELYAQAKLALEQDTQAKIAEIVARERARKDQENAAALQNYSALFDSMADLTKTFAGKQSSAYKAMFAVSKAFAIAESIVKIQQGIASAAANPWPTNIAAMASVAASTAGIVSAIQGTNYGGGRQYGGPVSAGSMYRVNEGGRPEMFTAANGSQYMMPTASGNVTPSGDVGGGAAQPWTINVYGAPAGTTSSVDQESRIVTIAVAEVANQITSNTGPVWGALRGSTNVKGRL